jgi:DNA-binding Lrp family transcriptional regulator
VVTLKELELKLISELMKNSRASDRELAKGLQVSQPTVSRLRARLEKEGIVKEYTMIPDFSKLGFNLMSIIMIKLNPMSEEDIQEIHRAARELDNEEHRPFLLIMRGIGLGKDLAMLSFHKDYAAYVTYMNDIKNAAYSKMKAFIDVDWTESFLIDLNYMDHSQPLTFSNVATYLQTNEKENALTIDR